MINIAKGKEYPYNNSMHDTSKDQWVWNKKKIIIAILSLLVFVASGYVLWTYFKGKSVSPLNNESVKGASTINPSSGAPISSLGNVVKTSFNHKLHQVEKELQSLNLQQEASKSAQVEKLMSNLKSLESYPSNQAKTVCQQICGSL